MLPLFNIRPDPIGMMEVLQSGICQIRQSQKGFGRGASILFMRSKTHLARDYLLAVFRSELGGLHNSTENVFQGLVWGSCFWKL